MQNSDFFLMSFVWENRMEQFRSEEGLRNLLVMHISYHVPSIFLIVIVSYWVVLSLVRLLASFAPCTHLGYSMLSAIYYWISTFVAILYLSDSVTCFVSYILLPLSLCFRT